MPYLEALGFHLVGYGCTTCIGNSGPLPEPIAEAVDEGRSRRRGGALGQRNFEGRINPLVRRTTSRRRRWWSRTRSPARMDIDLTSEPLGTDKRRQAGLPARHLADERGDRRDDSHGGASRSSSSASTRDVFDGDEQWQQLDGADGQTVRVGRRSRPTCSNPPFFEDMPKEPTPVADITGARVLALLGDSVTTDHISPAGSSPKTVPAAKYLIEHGVEPEDFNSYGARRGNHEVMMRGTFANIRLRNQMLPGVEGGCRRSHLPRRRRRCRSTTRR